MFGAEFAAIAAVDDFVAEEMFTIQLEADVVAGVLNVDGPLEAAAVDTGDIEAESAVGGGDAVGDNAAAFALVPAAFGDPIAGIVPVGHAAGAAGGGNVLLGGGGLLLFGEGDIDGFVVAAGDDDGLGAVRVVRGFGGDDVGAFRELQSSAGDGAGSGVGGAFDGELRGRRGDVQFDGAAGGGEGDVGTGEFDGLTGAELAGIAFGGHPIAAKFDNVFAWGDLSEIERAGGGDGADGASVEIDLCADGDAAEAEGGEAGDGFEFELDTGFLAFGDVDFLRGIGGETVFGDADGVGADGDAGEAHLAALGFVAGGAFIEESGDVIFTGCGDEE